MEEGILLGDVIRMDARTWRISKDVSKLFDRIANSYEQLRANAPILVELHDSLQLLLKPLDGYTYLYEGRVSGVVHNASVERVVEKVLGPLHRLYNIDWHLHVDNSFKELSFEAHYKKVSVAVRLYGAADCKWVLTGKKGPLTDQYELVCDDVQVVDD